MSDRPTSSYLRECHGVQSCSAGARAGATGDAATAGVAGQGHCAALYSLSRPHLTSQVSSVGGGLVINSSLLLVLTDERLSYPDVTLGFINSAVDR